jgi:murein DD-endopeptidase MepM/ murein hydrolase activator NlpD
MTAELTARVTVNTSDFQASLNSAYSDIIAKGKANAADLKSAYASSSGEIARTIKRDLAEAYREVKGLATSAATAGAGGTASGFDSSQMRQAAIAARERSAALQQFVDTAERAAIAGGKLNAQEQIYLTAAQGALRESVAEANALNQKANALERLTGVTDQASAAQGRARVSAGQMRAGFQQLGFQIGDVGQQMSQKGISGFTIFTQQAPQFVQALGMMTNSTKGFLGALGGMPGIVAIAAISIGGALYNALKGSEKAQKDAAKATEEHAKQLDNLVRSSRNALLSITQLAQAEASQALGDRADKETKLAAAREKLANVTRRLAEEEKIAALTPINPNGNFAQGAALERAAKSKAEVARLKTDLAAAQKEFDAAATAYASRSAAALATDAAARSTPEGARLADLNNKLGEAKSRYAALGGELRATAAETAAYTKEVAALTRQIEAANKSGAGAGSAQERERAKQARMTAFGSPIDMSARGVRVSGEVGNRIHPITGVATYHSGRDIAAAAGTAVKATADGTVIHVGTAGGYGNVIVIDHGNRISTKFGHLLDKGDVKVGDLVSKGQVIGRVGSTGNSTGNHLHYEVRSGDAFKGKALDPRTGKFAIDPAGADGSAAVKAEQERLQAAEDRAEAYRKISVAMAGELADMTELARLDEMRRAGQEQQAEKERILYELRGRYNGLIADDVHLSSEQRAELEKQLALVLQRGAAEADRRATNAANDNHKRTMEEFDREIAGEREIQRLDALRAAGLHDQAEQESAIYQYRSKYHDLLAGEPEMAAKLLGLTTEQVIAERKRLKEVTDVIGKGVSDSQAEDRFTNLAGFWERAMQSKGKSIADDFKNNMRSAISNVLAQWTIGLLNGTQQGLGSLLGSVIGVNPAGGAAPASGPASAIQGLLGGAGAFGPAGGPVSGILGAALAIPKLLGVGQIKNGGLITAGVGALFASLFGSAKRGSATLGFSNGELSVGETKGNSKSRIKAASGGVESLIDMLNNIADQLGGNITGAGSVSIGVRKKKYVVDPTGAGRTKGAGVLTFADEKEAVIAALRDSLSDAVITGISAASQRIISSGSGDLQKALQKALLIENIPKALKARFDPVGAALDDLNSKWRKTVDALKEGAASAEQFADARKLYDLERADILKAANDNLRGFINDLNFGPSSTYSLIDQAKKARAEVQPYLDQISAGNYAGVDQQRYLSGANDYLSIQRQIGGSGPEWFAAVDEFRNSTQRLADGLAAGSTANSALNPFAELTANSTASTANSTQATAEILANMNVQFSDMQATLAQIAANTGYGGDGFIGADRAFLNAA